MSWGRGTKDWEALAHALVHSGNKVTRALLFEVKCPEGTLEHEIYVNEMGSIVAPSGSEVNEIANIEVSDICHKFFTYFDATNKSFHG
ncbi:MAG: hypothetical protein CMB99_15640 [Flavobacteriaceae bacterium]|jgi:hypothetical protein|nr:hypothetical protein [Flavobacteriaceae bacterium]|tara:strand:+ start:7952 stop:8215 length:264 start_codon:yes stop_codon:yes gene_type:complete